MVTSQVYHDVDHTSEQEQEHIDTDFDTQDNESNTIDKDVVQKSNEPPMEQ